MKTTKLNVGLLCLIEFIWRYSQSCWYFRPIIVNYCPSNLLSGFLVIWFSGGMGVGGCYKVSTYY
jgi:hypothetical protein